MFILFDVGGTKIRIATSENLKGFSEPEVFETPKKFEDGITLFINTISKLVGGKKIRAVVGGIAGPFDEKKRTLVGSPQLKDWIGKPFKRELEGRFESPVYIENDAALAGLGESLYGAGRGYMIIAYITVSTGVGGVRIVNGKIDEKTIGFEPGNQIIDADKTMCPDCDDIHLGSLINGRSFEKRFGEKAQYIDNKTIWDTTAKYLAYGLHNVTVLWSPEIIVLGGSVMNKIDITKVGIYLARTLKIFPEIPELKSAELGDFGGLWGAMVYLRQRLGV